MERFMKKYFIPIVLAAALACLPLPAFCAEGQGTAAGGFVADIDKETVRNDNFRKVLFTAPHSQLVVMSLKPGEEIGTETHEKGDQFIRIEEGDGKLVMNGKEYRLEDDWAMVIPAGVEHNIINTGDEPMKLYAVYSPPEHPDGTVHKTKEDARKGDK